MSAHTPGQWETEWVGDTGGENPEDVFNVIADKRRIVCEYVNTADARLIAVAPELLEALEHLLTDATDVLRDGPNSGVLIEAANAIKKARGA